MAHVCDKSFVVVYLWLSLTQKILRSVSTLEIAWLMTHTHPPGLGLFYCFLEFDPIKVEVVTQENN